MMMTDYDCVDRYVRTIGRFLPEGRVKTHDRQGYVDKRGWDCKPARAAYFCHKEFRSRLEKLGLARSVAATKKTPAGVLQSPRPVVVAYLSGLFEGDGSAFL